MTARSIAEQRLVNQRLHGGLRLSVAGAVRRMGAVQAQDYHGGLWAIGLRAAGSTEASVEQALADGLIVRTWPMRGTLHIVPSRDVRWMLKALTPRAIRKAATRFRKLGLEQEVLGRARRLFEKKLRGAEPVTRSGMYDLLIEAGISPAGQRGINILARLAQDGVICFGPRRGAQQTFVLLEEWIPPGRMLERDEALAELALRYFRSHGPATAGDFAWWTGITLAETAAALEGAKSRLEHEDVDGARYWGPAGPSSSGAPRTSVVLLPPFDELLVAYRDRSAALDRGHPSGVQILLSPTIAEGGHIVGTWARRELSAARALTIRFFESPPPATVRAVEHCARRYGRFAGTDVKVDVR
jgi:hypothetical protein